MTLTSTHRQGLIKVSRNVIGVGNCIHVASCCWKLLKLQLTVTIVLCQWDVTVSIHQLTCFFCSWRLLNMCRIVTVIQAAHVFFCLKVRSSFPFSLFFTDMLLDLKSLFFFPLVTFQFYWDSLEEFMVENNGVENTTHPAWEEDASCMSTSPISDRFLLLSQNL